MNNKVWIILFTFVIDINCVNGFSYGQAYHTQSKTWAAASDECDSKEVEFDENVLMKTDVLRDKEFWIGMAVYHVTTPWIEVIGCSAVPDRRAIKKEPSIVLCQIQCESYPFFGYSETTKMCSCLHDNGSSYSIKNCIEPNNSTHFFVYEVFSGNISVNNDGKCTTLYCYGGTNGLTSVSCNDQNRGTVSRCNDGSEVGWGHLYSKGKQMCLDKYQLMLSPETYCRLMGNKNGARHAWTNVFRAETEAKLTQAEAGTKDPLYCLAGSFAIKNEKRELNTTRRNCNDQLDFVCRTGAISLTTSKQSLLAVQKTDKVSSTKRASGVHDLMPDGSSATISSQNVIATKTMGKDSSVSFDIGPIIGGIAGAIAFLAVLVVIIVCKIRSCEFFKSSNTDKQEVQFSTKIYEHSENPEVKTSETPTSTCSNESYGLVSINTVHTYAVVNKIKKNGLQTTEDTYTETSYGEYDRFNGASKRRTDSKTNLYDSHVGIRNESDPTYDSSDHGGRKLQLDNDVYDHTDTLSMDGSDYGYSSTLKSEVRNENEVYDKTV